MTAIDLPTALPTLLGLPYDASSSFLRGPALAPARIREELHAGKAVIPAVDAGFSKALLTIIDTHVTTVVSCAILFLFGSGPVKGFAVTLVIGLVANVFTAVFVSRFIFDWELSRPKPVTALSI